MHDTLKWLLFPSVPPATLVLIVCFPVCRPACQTNCLRIPLTIEKTYETRVSARPRLPRLLYPSSL